MLSLAQLSPSFFLDIYQPLSTQKSTVQGSSSRTGVADRQWICSKAAGLPWCPRGRTTAKALLWALKRTEIWGGLPAVALIIPTLSVSSTNPKTWPSILIRFEALDRQACRAELVLQNTCSFVLLALNFTWWQLQYYRVKQTLLREDGVRDISCLADCWYHKLSISIIACITIKIKNFTGISTKGNSEQLWAILSWQLSTTLYRNRKHLHHPGHAPRVRKGRGDPVLPDLSFPNPPFWCME